MHTDEDMRASFLKVREGGDMTPASHAAAEGNLQDTMQPVSAERVVTFT